MIADAISGAYCVKSSAYPHRLLLERHSLLGKFTQKPQIYSGSILKKLFLSVRPYCLGDYEGVVDLLEDLPLLYPDGEYWLERRLGEVLDGKARCNVVVDFSGVVGVTIETPKTTDLMKLSTIYVRPSHRRLGLGTYLVNRCRKQWIRDGVKQAYVTADVRLKQILLPTFERVGFSLTEVQRDRYGSGRDEMVFGWNAHRS